MMKCVYSSFLLAIILLTGTSLPAQVDPPCLIPGATLCDDMDSYTVDDEVGPQSSWWDTWDGTEGDASDGTITDEFAFSGSNSLLIPEGGTVDVVLLLGNQTAGIWRLRWMMYVPDEQTGYFNIQESETPGIAWNMEALFGLYDYVTPAPSGEGTVLIPATYDFIYPVDQWFMIDLMIDLDGEEIEYYVNGELVFSSTYSGNLGAVNYYSIDGDNRYFVDDVLLIDNTLLNTYFADLDSDGFGDDGNSILIVGDPPPGYVLDNTDCNDTDEEINPDATEICNDFDDNCNGETDEGLLTTFYADADGDTFGDADATEEACELTAGLSENGADCDDTNANIYPGAVEFVNGLDDDCDELIDENVSLNDIVFASGISVYPIPASDNFTIEIPAQYETVRIQLVDMCGRIVYSNSTQSDMDIKMQIDVSLFSSGMYQIEIIAGDNIAIKQTAVK